MSTLNVSNITDGTDTVETGYVLNGSAKAWVKMDSGAVILDSFNVSSTSDDGTGDYSITFSNNFSSVNYSSAGTCNSGSQARTFTFNSSVAGNTGLLTWISSTGAAVDSTTNSSFQGELA